MSNLVLTVQNRENNEKGRQLRRDGFIPAVVYSQGKESMSIKFNAKDFESLFRGHIPTNVQIDLEQDGKILCQAFVKEVQRAFVSHHIEHIDFLSVDANTPIHITIPIKLTGDAIGIVEGGVLDFMARTIEIECLPKNVPSAAVVDVTNLKAGESIHAGDIDLGENVKITSAHNATIVSIIEPKGASEEETKEEESTSEAGAASA